MDSPSEKSIAPTKGTPLRRVKTYQFLVRNYIDFVFHKRDEKTLGHSPATGVSPGVNAFFGLITHI
jgi:hypothetical protein